MSQLRIVEAAMDGFERDGVWLSPWRRTRMNRRTFYFLTAALTYLLALTIVGATGKDAPETAATQPSRPTEPAFRVALAAAQGATAQAAAGEYVGDDAKCIDCHDTVWPSRAPLTAARSRIEPRRPITAASRATGPPRSTSTRKASPTRSSV